MSANKRGREPDSPNSVIKNQEKKNKMDSATSAKIDQILSNLLTLQTGQNQLQSVLTQLQGDVHRVIDRVGATEIVVQNLQHENETLSGDLNFLRQKEFKQTFALLGFPKGTNGEDMFVAIKKIGGMIGVQIEGTDFSRRPHLVTHRNNRTAHIAGTFYSAQKRDEFHFKFREKKRTSPIVLEDIVISLDPDHQLRAKPLTLRWELTDYTKKLLVEAKKYAANFKYIWETDGRVLLKRDDASKPINIHTFAQLQLAVASIMQT